MAQAGYTPIQLYRTSTPAATPTAGNLADGELAINTADGKLFYKDSGGVVQVIAGKNGAGVAAGSNTQVQFNSSGNLAGSANLTFDGTILTSTAFSGPLNGSVGATTPSTGVFTQVNVTAQGDVRFEDTSGGQYVALQAPGTVASNVVFTLPAADGTSGQVIQTDGSGNLSFTTPSSGITTGKSIAMAMIFGF
jgi:hypothetical protein